MKTILKIYKAGEQAYQVDSPDLTDDEASGVILSVLAHLHAKGFDIADLQEKMHKELDDLQEFIAKHE